MADGRVMTSWGRRVVLGGLLAAICLIVAAPSSAATVIGFDDLPAGTMVSAQYHAQGVDFFDPPTPPPVRRVTAVPVGEAASGTQVLDIEKNSDYPSSVSGTFATPASSVSVSVGLIHWVAGLPDVATLTAFDGNGNALAQAQVMLLPPGNGFHAVLSLTRAQFDIKSFTLATSQVGDGLGIDDLTFDRPTVTVQVDGPGVVAGAGGISCPAACVAGYASGTTLTLTAAASPGSVFAGWAGACAGFAAQPACVLTVNSNLSVGASFRSPVVTVSRSGDGAGSVRSTPAGIDCGASCAGTFNPGTAVVLVASPAAGSKFAGWGGACALSGLSSTCSLTISGDTPVSASFQRLLAPQGFVAPLIDSGSGPALPALFAPPQSSLSVDVKGSGSVTSSPRGSGAQRALATPRIACGGVAFVCYGTAPPGARWTLRALAAEGQVFKHWTGACTGTRPTCVSSFDASGSVGAVFAPRRATRTLAVTLDPPRFHVGWTRSVGGGTLVLAGKLARPALLRIQLRRPFGAPLLSELLTVGAGRFRHVVRLSPGLFSHGARLFPGGFIVVVGGRSGSYEIVRQLRTIVLPAPARGVVRRAYASGSKNGTPLTTVRANSGRVFAHFVFETQPRRGQRITVAWFWPDGRLLGKITKPNRPTVTSSLGSAAPLPPGNWRAELRVGGKVVSALRVALR